MRIKFLIILIFCMAGFVSVVSVSFCETSGNQVVLELIKNAILAEDWNTVAERCGPSDQLESSPVLRAIKGHACLALNRNNESLLLLLSVNDDEDTKVWYQWSSEFVNKNPGNHVTHYFKGDALARLGEWDSAIKAFDEAIRLKPDFALALNGRGVVYAYKGKWNESLDDLDKANEKDPKFADAHASLGTMSILNKAPEGAKESFDKALSCSSEFALAINGRGCAEYGLATKWEHWEQASKTFAEAGGEIPLPLFVENLRSISLVAEDVLLPELKGSPLFRVSDFIDWKTLQQSSANEDDILRTLIGGSQLSETLDTNVIMKLNDALDNPQFYNRIKERINNEEVLEKLWALIIETATFRNNKAVVLTEEQREKIRLLNRMIIEWVYPCCIAQHDNRNPGTHFRLEKGFVDSYKDKSILPSETLIRGNYWMGRFKDIANFVPFFGGLWKDHLNNQIGINNHILNGRGINPQVGGVDMTLSRIHHDDSEWPVTNWFGLAYVSR